MTRRQQIIELTIVLALIFGAYVIVRGDGPTVYPNGLTRSGISFQVLTADTLKGGAPRSNVWREDKTQSDEWRAKQADYVGSGMDIFHLAPAGDYGSGKDKDSTFILTNAAPGDRGLNRGLWNKLERTVREMVSPTAIVQIYTGPCYVPSGDGILRVKTLGADKLWIPTHFGKAVVVEEEGKPPRSYAWLVANESPRSANLDAYRVSINELEFFWGYDCRWGLDADVEDRLEKDR